MNNKIHTKGNFELNILNIFIYLVSPFLAIPTILYSLSKKNNFNPILYSLLVAFISYIFIPTIEMDKYRHLEFYDFSKYFTIEQFFIYNFQDSPDFIFRSFLYLGALNGINFHYVVFFVTFITVYLIFKVYFHYLSVNKTPATYKVLILLLFIFSLSYIDMFSGLRYTLATSFSFYGLYKGVVCKNKWGVFFLILGVLTHFSTAIFLILYLVFPMLNLIKVKRLKLLLLLSLLFMFIPQSFMLDLIKGIGLGEAMDNKAEAYLIEEDVNEVLETFSTIFIKFFNIIWVVIISLYFVLKKQSSYSIYYKVLIFLLIFINIFISIPVIFNRYTLFVKLFLVLFLIDNELKLGKHKLAFILLGILIIININQAVILREGLSLFFNPSIENWGFLARITNKTF